MNYFPVNITLIDFFIIAMMLFVSIAVIYNSLKYEYIIGLWSPIIMVTIFYLHYTIFSPLYFVFNNSCHYGYFDMSPYVTMSWCGAFLSYIFIVLGFSLTKKPLKINDISQYIDSWKIGKIISILAITAGIFKMGLNFSSVASFGILQNENSFDNIINDQGLLRGYIQCCLDFCYAGLTLMFIGLLDKYSHAKFLNFIIFLLIILSLCLISGFRYRLVCLAITLISSYYLIKKKKFNLFFWIPLVIFFVACMGVIGSTRNYSRGLDLTKLSDKYEESIFERGIGETKIFFATGALMEKVRINRQYIGFTPAFTALCMPIPRSLFPEKPDAKYLIDANIWIFQTSNMGVAFISYGELFYSFGWFGIIIFSYILGFFCKKVWFFYLRSRSIYSILILVLFNGYLYVYLSRGYMSQQITFLFFMIIIPIVLVNIMKTNTSKGGFLR